jgi:anti-anti-sigma factor
MDLEIAMDDGRIAAINCTGHITRDWADDPLEKLLGPQCYSRMVMLNLKRARFIDSSGIGWLVVSHRRFETAGGKMVLHSAPTLVTQALHFVQSHAFLTIVSCEEDARGLLMQFMR